MYSWTKFLIASAMLTTIAGILIYARTVHAATSGLGPFALPRA
jgi:hypothetical protein